MRKLTGGDKKSLTAKAKRGIHTPPPVGGRVFGHLWGSSAPSRVAVTWEDRRRHATSPLPSRFTAEHDAINGTEYPCGSYALGQLSQPCPLPALRAPQPARRGAAKTPALRKALLSSNETNTAFGTNPECNPVVPTTRNTSPTPAKSNANRSCTGPSPRKLPLRKRAGSAARKGKGAWGWGRAGRGKPTSRARQTASGESYF